MRDFLRGAYHLLLVVWTVALGAGLGLGSVWLTVETRAPFGERRVQAWTAWPNVGAPENDPYARAIVARTGDVPLAQGEGIAFHALVDDDGRALDAACVYRIAGETPAARYWTLTITDEEGRLVRTPQGRPSLTSAEILRQEDATFVIWLSRRPRSGNWLQLPERGPVQPILRLYDTPVSAAFGWLAEGGLPKVTRVSCAPEAVS